MMITCRDFVEFLWKYSSEDLSEDERAQFDAHLATCAPCVRYLKSYHETIQAGKGSFTDLDDLVPPEVPEELVHAILSSRKQVV